MTKKERKKLNRVKTKRKMKNMISKKFNMNMIYNSSPHMLHENKYVPMNCVLCGVKMNTIHDTHNPFPITEKCFPKDTHETGNPNRCCSACNLEKVIPARLGAIGKSWFPTIGIKKDGTITTLEGVA